MINRILKYNKFYLIIADEINNLVWRNEKSTPQEQNAQL